jgi:hypothetical protein
MSVKVIEHKEMKLIGIPCVSLREMKSKYQNAKEGLLSASKHLPNIINRQIHYGIWPQLESQNNSETHVYILCVEVETFEGIPEWFFKTTLKRQQCVVANDNSDRCFDAAGEKITDYMRKHRLEVSAEGHSYTICERYSYEEEGYSRYSLPII